MSTNKKITLNFFGEIVSIANPQSLDSLRNSISSLFCFSPEDAKEILITYNENGDKIMIENDEDLKAFLKSKVTTIDLDISQTSQIYKKNAENIKQENEKDKLALESLLKSKYQTKLFIDFINRVINNYLNGETQDKVETRKRNILKELYIKGQKQSEFIYNNYEVERTFYLDEDKLIKDLAPYFFGIKGLNI